jgi:hypothetical protein
VTWAGSLDLSRIADIDQRMEHAEATPTGSPLQLRKSFDTAPEDQRLVTNCNQFLRSVAEGFIPLTTFDVNQSSVFVRHCYVLREVKKASEAQYDWLPAWSPQIVAIAPPLLQWMPERRDTLEETWAAADPDLRVQEQRGEMIIAEDELANYTLERMASGDFNSDGVTDIAVFGAVSLERGSLTKYDYYVLTRCGGDERLVLITSQTMPFAVNEFRCR